MPNRSSKPKPKRPRDINKLASSIVKAATEGEQEPETDKNPAAVELGRPGRELNARGSVAFHVL